MKVITRTIALLRHLRAERGMALVLVIVVAFTAFVMAAIPRLYNQTLDEELQYRVAGAPADWRNITVTKQQRTTSGDYESIFGRLEAGSLAYYEGLPPDLTEVISGRGYVVESQKSPVLQTRMQPPLEFARSFQFRFQGDVGSHITLVDGRWPEPRRPVLFSDLTGTPGARGEQPTPRYEVAVSQTTLQELEFERGRYITVRLAASGERVIIHLVGVFTVDDPQENYWNADTRLNEPVVAGFATDFGEVLEVVAIPADATYDDMLTRAGGQVPWHNAWVYYVDPERLSLDNYPSVSAEIRQLKLSLGPIDELRNPSDTLLASTGIQPQITFPEFDAADPTVLNELPLVLERFAGQARLTSSVIALATLGIMGVGLAALGLLAALIDDRRRGMVTLLRSRGASRGQLAIARVVEGLLLCLPAALLGLAVATVVVDARGNVWSWRAAAATGLLTVALLVAAAAGSILPRLGVLLSGRQHGLRGVSFRRLMLEALVILLAAAGIFLLRQRGLEPDVDAEGLGGFDPFLTAVPVLLALAAGIALLRLYPFPIRLLAWFARWLRGTVLFMGLRRMAFQSTAANLPLLVLLLAVGVSVFTSIVAYSVDRARIDLVWSEVRADYRLDVVTGFGQALPDLDLTGIDGVEAQAREFRTRDANLAPLSGQATLRPTRGTIPSFTLLAVETGEFEQVVRGTSADFLFPGALLDPQNLQGVGTLENPAPAIITSGWPEEAGDPPEPGDLLHFKVAAAQLSGSPSVFVRVVAERASYPGLSDNAPFLIMRWDALFAALAPQHARPVRPTTIYLKTNDLERAELEEAISAQTLTPVLAEFGRSGLLGIGLTSRGEMLDDLRDAPLARGLTNSFRFSVALAAIYGGLVVVVALVLTARERSRDLGYLRTLGLDSRQALGMTLTEMVPGVLLACGLGVPLGIAIARLVEPGLDLRAFVGPDVAVSVVVDRPTAIAVAAGLALVALLAVAIFSALARRVQLGEVLRVE